MGYPSYNSPTPERPRRWVSDETIDNWTAYHPPVGGKVRLHEAIRQQFNETLRWLNNVLPEGPDKTNALQACRHAMNAANTAVACNPLEPDIDEYYQRDVERVQTILGVDDRQRIDYVDERGSAGDEVKSTCLACPTNCPSCTRDGSDCECYEHQDRLPSHPTYDSNATLVIPAIDRDGTFKD